LSLSSWSERLLIVIPAFNEQTTIRQVVSSARQAAPQADVLVVDDGSADHTAQEAEAASAFVLRHPFNLGIGGAVQTGLKFAQREAYDMVIRLDADGQHRPADIPLIYTALATCQADMVVGSRFLAQGMMMPIPLLRRLGIYIFALAVSLLTGCRATDTTSGFMGLNRRAIALLIAYMPQDYPEVESRIILHKAGLRTLELPVCMGAREAGVSSINSWRSIYYACKVLVAALITIFKDIPAAPVLNQAEEKESTHAYTHRTTSHSHHPQPHLFSGDGSSDT
jgi:hypothetical protein